LKPGFGKEDEHKNFLKIVLFCQQKQSNKEIGKVGDKIKRALNKKAVEDWLTIRDCRACHKFLKLKTI